MRRSFFIEKFMKTDDYGIIMLWTVKGEHHVSIWYGSCITLPKPADNWIQIRYAVFVTKNENEPAISKGRYFHEN